MKPRTLSISVALLALSACNHKPEQVTSTAPDPLAAELANRPPVVLPPMMTSEVTFRCKDQSLVYVDFFQGDRQLLVKTDKTGSGVKLAAEKAGDPYKADGYTVTGSPKSISIIQPGKPQMTCEV